MSLCASHHLHHLRVPIGEGLYPQLRHVRRPLTLVRDEDARVGVRPLPLVHGYFPVGVEGRVLVCYLCVRPILFFGSGPYFLSVFSPGRLIRGAHVTLSRLSSLRQSVLIRMIKGKRSRDAIPVRLSYRVRHLRRLFNHSANRSRITFIRYFQAFHANASACDQGEATSKGRRATFFQGHTQVKCSNGYVRLGVIMVVRAWELVLSRAEVRPRAALFSRLLETKVTKVGSQRIMLLHRDIRHIRRIRRVNFHVSVLFAVNKGRSVLTFLRPRAFRSVTHLSLFRIVIRCLHRQQTSSVNALSQYSNNVRVPTYVFKVARISVNHRVRSATIYLFQGAFIRTTIANFRIRSQSVRTLHSSRQGTKIHVTGRRSHVELRLSRRLM